MKTTFLGAALVAAFFMCGTASQALTFDEVPDAAKQGDIVFSMARKGNTIGNHSVTFTPLDDGRLQVDVAIAIKVKVAFITVFKYAHHNREIWSADGTQLLAIDAKTKSNSTEVSIRGAREGDVFRMTDEDGTVYDIEGTVVPTSYWNASILEAGARILNSQKGTLADAVFAATTRGATTLPNGAAVPSQMFEAQGELNNVFVDFAKDGQCWVGLSFIPPKQDVPIAYDLERHFSAPRPDLAAFAPLSSCLNLSAQEETLRRADAS